MNADSRHLLDGDDPDITAELPMLTGLAEESTESGSDTVAGATAIFPALVVPPADPLTGTDNWPQLRVAHAPEAASTGPRVEDELRSLSESLEALQRRLAERGERVARLEADLAQAQISYRSSADQASALQEELTAANTALSASLARIQELQAAASGRDEQLQAALVREGELQQDLARKNQEKDRALLQQDSQVQAEMVLLRMTVADLQRDLGAARVSSAVQLETLQSLEGRRGIYDSQLRGLDAEVLARDQKLAQLTADLGQGADQIAALQRDLEARAQRITALEAHLAAQNGNLASRTDEVDAAARDNAQLRETLRTLTEQSAAEAARHDALTAELTARHEAQAAASAAEHAAQLSEAREAVVAHQLLERAHAHLQETHAGTRNELDQLMEQSREHATLVQEVAAQHAGRVAKLEESGAHNRELILQLASRDAVIEDLTRTNSELRGYMDEAHQWLKERDSLMQRLETEAVHSQALVDNIQHSIKHLAPSTGATGPYEALPMSVRLLMRMEQGQEIVHVLGVRTTIGRTSDNDLQIEAAYISRHHAVILTSAAHAIIEDLGSTNGVYVGGQRVTRHLLKDGDTVIIGKQPFTYAVRIHAMDSGDDSKM